MSSVATLLERRPLGHTGHHSSVLTFGGICVLGEEQSAANRMVAEALDRGVNQFDVAPTYGDAELRLGEALRGRRDQVFLGCKTTCRDKAGAAAELRQSLQRLQTDHVDLYQCHGLNEPADLEVVLGPGGALEAFEEARAEGLVRFLGLTGHVPGTLAQGLRRYSWDTVMFPQNFFLQEQGWGLDLRTLALEQGVGLIAIKPIAAEPWGEEEERVYGKCWYRPFDTAEEVGLALRHVLATPVSTAIPSGHWELTKLALEAASAWEPLTEEEVAHLRRRAGELRPLFTREV
jgi:predicted aldo/keto reductase-like oxidoreductase